MDVQLQQLLASLQGLSDRLAMDGHFVDSSMAAGAIQAIRALRTKLEPAPAPEAPSE